MLVQGDNTLLALRKPDVQQAVSLLDGNFNELMGYTNPVSTIPIPLHALVSEVQESWG